MKHASALVLVALIIPWHSAAEEPSAKQSVIVARATSGRLQSTVVSFVANNFKETVLTGAPLERARKQTTEQVITSLCGAVTPTYYKEFETANGGKSRRRDIPLGDDAATLRFPACLKVAPLNWLWRSTSVRDPASPFATQVFGAAKTPPRPSKNGPWNLTAMFASKAQIAIPTELSPKDGVTSSAAINGLQASSRAGGGSEVKVASASPMRGHIVEVVDRSAIDPKSKQALTCPVKSMAYDARLVERLYSYSLGRRPSTSRRGVAHVTVVDNGFFGVKPSIPPQYTDAFPESLFGLWSKQASLVGPVTPSDQAHDIDPINYRNGFDNNQTPSEIAGHGTHVAGLTVGGPEFEQSRDTLLLNPKDLRVDLTLINVGGGEKDLVRESQAKLADLMQRAPDGANLPLTRIVNLSVAYEQPQAAGTFDALFGLHPSYLFIVAAGNGNPGGQDAGPLGTYPGALGNRPNVISVAAHDAADVPNLAWFSNYGSTSVDIAAPGCGVESWVDGTSKTALTGTSQAAPLVTFAATLLTSLDDSLSAWQLKARLISSGGLLASDRWNVVSGSRLDIPVSLALYDDLVEVRVDDKKDSRGYHIETWLGDVSDVWALRCKTDRGRLILGRDKAQIWALKRQEDDYILFVDRNLGRVSPCEATVTAPTADQSVPFVSFSRRAAIVGSDVQADSLAGPEQKIFISKLERMVIRGPYAGSEIAR